MQIESLILCQETQKIHVPMNAPGTGVDMGTFGLQKTNWQR